jgi:methylmalonyl-CoA decarboxylase
LFSGAPIEADRARSVGLLNHVVEGASLEEFTFDLAEQIAGNAPFSIRSMKWIADAVAPNGLDDSKVSERAASLRHEAFETADYREGVAAFADDRDPAFEGR